METVGGSVVIRSHGQYKWRNAAKAPGFHLMWGGPDGKTFILKRLHTSMTGAQNEVTQLLAIYPREELLCYW